MQHCCSHSPRTQSGRARLCRCMPGRRLSKRCGGEFPAYSHATTLPYPTLQPQAATSCSARRPLHRRAADKLYHRTQTHNAPGTRPNSARMVRVADEALPMAEKVACRFVAAPTALLSISWHGCSNTPHRLRSPGQHILGVQGPAARTAKPPHSQVQPENPVQRCRHIACVPGPMATDTR
jgi:hypothetical protein